MRILYIECNMGVAGDMLLGALSEIAPRDAVGQLTSLDIPGVEIRLEDGEKCGIHGTHARVFVHGEEEGHEHHYDHGHEHEHEHDHEHHHNHEHERHHDHAHAHEPEHHNEHHHEHVHDHEELHSHHHEHEHHHHHHHAHHSMEDIRGIIQGLDVPEKVQQDAMTIYGHIAAAESKVHGQPVTEVHFHEVGAMDAVADVTGNALLLNAIGADRIVISPINVGSGTVRCAHGILPVPAPATAEILKDMEYYGDDTKGELCTPTGAAILKAFAHETGPRPTMKVVASGVGVGTKDFPGKANLVRVFLGETAEGPVGTDGPEPKATSQTRERTGETAADGTPLTICELSANIDDMTGEELGFAMEELLSTGALDVYYTPIIMKKSRPAVKLSCLCAPEKEVDMVEVMFRNTRTAGIRRQTFQRYVLERETQSEHGLRRKTYRGYGVERTKTEYEDLAEEARRKGISLLRLKEENA